MGQGRFRALARQDLGTWAQTPVLSNFKSCWAGSMAQVIECLPSKLGAMSSKPCTKKRKKGKKKKMFTRFFHSLLLEIMVVLFSFTYVINHMLHFILLFKWSYHLLKVLTWKAASCACCVLALPYAHCPCPVFLLPHTSSVFS
jgi:hypothetical protein